MSGQAGNPEGARTCCPDPAPRSTPAAPSSPDGTACPRDRRRHPAGAPDRRVRPDRVRARLRPHHDQPRDRGRGRHQEDVLRALHRPGRLLPRRLPARHGHPARPHDAGVRVRAVLAGGDPRGAAHAARRPRPRAAVRAGVAGGGERGRPQVRRARIDNLARFRAFFTDPSLPPVPVAVVDAVVGGVYSAIHVRMETDETEDLPALLAPLTYFALLPFAAARRRPRTRSRLTGASGPWGCRRPAPRPAG